MLFFFIDQMKLLAKSDDCITRRILVVAFAAHPAEPSGHDAANLSMCEALSHVALHIMAIRPLIAKLNPHGRYAYRDWDVQVDHLVIGAGVVGLAVANALARRWPEKTTYVIERHSQAGQETRYVLKSKLTDTVRAIAK